VLSLILIKLFYFYRYFLYDRYAFVSFISFLIIIPATRIDSRVTFFRFTGTFRSANLSHSKPSSITLGKCPAGATSDTDGNSEFPKYFCKFANPSDRIYIAPSRYLLYQRYARRYFAILDKKFPFYFIPDRRIRCIYYANINKKYFIIKFYYSALFRCRVDIIFINRFLDPRLLR
jgi:hypothetical protein